MDIFDPYGFIYITTNMINGKRYIGQKKFDNESRWKSYLGSGYYLMKDIKKYGKENFIRNIVDIVYTQDELNEKEKFWIINYNAVSSSDYYNAIEGGDPYKQLTKRNSVPIICLNNRMIFNSIADTIIWSGHTEKTIKNTFKMSFKENKDKKLIFRPLKKRCTNCNELFYSSTSRKKCDKCSGYAHCLDCGIEIKKETKNHVRCEECDKERIENLRKLKRKHNKKKLGLSKEEFDIFIEIELRKVLKSKIWLELAKKKPRQTINQI